MAPKGCEKPATILIALQAGAEIGLSPMQSIQSIAVINGRPSIYGDGLQALILSHPSCGGIDETLEGEGDAMTATCRMIRRGFESPIVRSFSVADAKRAKLWGKPGPWECYPQRMLRWRAFSWAARDAFADVLRGIAVAEEQSDIVDVQVVDAKQQLREHLAAAKTDMERPA